MKQKARTRRAFWGVHGTAWRCMKRLYGAGTRNRTRDLLITSQLLYLLSYTGEGRHYSDWLGRVNLPRREGVMSADAYAQKA